MNYAEFLDEYKEMLKQYCYAGADLPIRKDEDGEYYTDIVLKDNFYVLGGHFDSDYVASEILLGDFPFAGIDKEGFWHFDFLLKYVRGDYEEPSYMELLHTEPTFQISFEEQARVDKEMINTELKFNHSYRSK